MIKSIGVVGAGLSALTCSHELLRTGVGRIDIFEKSRGLAGRAATRRENGYAFDHGANYFSLDLLDSIQRRTITDFIGLVDW
jgi:predicted NAD/FAD-dependent oxidoreductase